MKKFLFLIFTFLIFPFFVLASDKVEINTASLEQLDEIIGIGPVLGQRIIDTRPFSSIDDLIRVKGIGEKTLQKIKDQGLAYVERQVEQPTTKTFIEISAEIPIETSIEISVEKPAIKVYPSEVIINEILPSPEGADEENEWIEIYNQNNFEIDLAGWKIQDTEGKVTIYTISNNTKIKAKNYLVLPRPLTKITLNNTSDGLKLSQPNNKVVDSVTFQKAPTGQSYNRTDSGWMWSSTLTPGAANIIFSTQTITKAGPKQNQDSQIDKTNYKAGLAGIYSSLSRNLPGAKDPWFLFLIAIIITIVSGIIVIFIKWKMRKNP